MNTGTYKAIKAILGADASLSDAQRKAVLRSCEDPDPGHSFRSNPRPQFVSVKEASEILGTSRRSIFRLIQCGRLERIKLGHRTTRFRLEDLANITSEEPATPDPS